MIAEAEPTLVGHYSGPVSRLVAWVLDALLIGLTFSLTIGGGLWVFNLITGSHVPRDDIPAWLWSLLLVTWIALYFGYCWASSGQTPGMAVFGLRVVAGDGEHLAPRHALVRLVVYPLSFLFFGLGMVGIVVGRRHRALHDVAADSAVVYDWDARAAHLRFLARRPLL